MNKLILNIQFSQQVKFKIAFDTSGQKTFDQLKQICVQRLEAFQKISPENLKETLPDNFDPSQYHLTDQTNFILSDQDIVEDLCSNNELINLVLNQSLSQSVQDPQKMINTSIGTSINVQQSQTVVQPQKVQSTQPVQQNQEPQTTSQNTKSQPPPQSAVQQPTQPLLKNQQIADGFMDEAKKNQLKQDFYLDTSQWNQTQQIQSDIEISIRFLQAEDQFITYTLGCQLDDTLFNLSCKICNQLQLPQQQQNHVILYSLAGLPIISNLNQLHQKTVDDTINKLQNKIFYAIITKCSAGDKSFPKIDPDEGKEQIFIIHQGPKVLKVDIETTTVLQLKQKIYHKLNIPTNVQNLIYGGKLLTDNLILKDYNIQNNSNLNLSFKLNQFVSHADSFNYNFYMPWLNHFVKQSEEGIRQFRCNMLVFFAKEDQQKLSHTIRQYSKNNAPLTLASVCLLNKYKLNQNARIAFEEGFLRLFFDLIISSPQIPVTFDLSSIFEYSRQWIQFLYDQTTNFNQVDVKFVETYKKVDYTCWVTLNPIETPAFLSLNENEEDKSLYQIVDYNTIKTKQETQEKHTNGKLYSQLKLIKDPNLEEQFKIVKFLEKEDLIWLPQTEFKDKRDLKALPAEWHKNSDIKLQTLKIYSSVELKLHPSAPVLTKNSLKQLVVYTSMNKDVAKPVNLFDPLSGNELSDNPDQIAYNQVLPNVSTNKNNTNLLDEDDDSSIQLVTQITVEPEEAIIVLIDISGSMEEDFYKNEDLTRLGAVKAFFNAFADRTMAYNMKNVISLAYFDDRYILKCGFTELFMQFKDLVNKAKPQGMTALYVALKNAIDSLLIFKKKYPNCLLRIIALTDGEDNKGRFSPEFIAKTIVENQIILDSFVVYDKCDGLKQITKAAGGQCFCPKTIQEGLKLFEYETILSAKIRKPQEPLTNFKIEAIFKQDPKTIKFDVQPREFELPLELKKQSVNPKQLVRRISSDSQQLNLIAPNNNLKRVIKELITYEQKPHPFVKVFPCSHDVSFWKIILIGPEQTPYYGGIYILYMKFPQEYPVQPPDLRFLTSIYHCNINSQGRICHSILGRNYTPDTRVLQIFEAIYGLLMTPEPDDPLDTTIASEYMQDLKMYQQKATNHTLQYAKRPMDEVLKEILGTVGEEIALSDIELQEKINEINVWITNSSKPQ
ncbi:unnamed protein product [Paramecium sonneborni]|uniref:Ubiquitin-conjugating enzyme E2 n=1 Tax=Paramecium sonneborni TaxID=65129 RepID=A0A8S1KXL4_9CILI|nr:unnamed protein product [Paramecium sonneborni]